MLGRLNLITYAPQIGSFIQLLGIMVMLSALAFGVYKVFFKAESS